MFMSTAYDPALAESTGIQVDSLDDRLVRCHEVSPFEATIMSSQLDSLGNNCFLYQKKNVSLTLFYYHKASGSQVG